MVEKIIENWHDIWVYLVLGYFLLVIFIYVILDLRERLIKHYFPCDYYQLFILKDEDHIAVIDLIFVILAFVVGVVVLSNMVV